MVAESSQDKTSKTHLYINIKKVPGSTGVATLKREASSFKAVKAYVKQVLRDGNDTLEEQKTIVRSFETITDSFANKKTKFIHRIFFFILILKKLQLSDARNLIKNFDAFIEDPSSPGLGSKPGLEKKEEKPRDLKKLNAATIESLKESKNYKYSIITACFDLDKEPIGSYAVWESSKRGEHIFFLKKKELDQSNFKHDTIPPDAVVIPANKNLQQEINRLTSLENNFALFSSQYKIHTDYESAVKALDGPDLYALYNDSHGSGSKDLRFIQQIPGLPLTPAQSIVIKSTQDPFALLREQTSIDHQCKLLKEQGKFFSDFSESHKARKKLKNPGDFLIYKSSKYASPTLYYINKDGNEQSETYYSIKKTLFYLIQKSTAIAQDNKEFIAKLKQEGKAFTSSYDAEKYLKKLPAGSFVYADSYYGTNSLHFKIPNKDFNKTNTIWIKEKSDIQKKIAKLSSNEGLFSILKGESLTAKDEKNAMDGLRYKSNGDYVVWKSAQGAYCMLMKNSSKVLSSDVITLDLSNSNLFAEIEKQFPNPKKHPAYETDITSAKAKLVNMGIGDFVFVEREAYFSKEFSILMKTSTTKYSEFKVSADQLFYQLAALKTSEGLWNFFKKAGYAFDSREDAKAAQKNQEFFIWKEKQSMMFMPAVRGVPFGSIKAIDINPNQFLDNLRKFQNPDNKLCHTWFEGMGVIVNNETDARKTLLQRPLGSYVLWRELDSWCFLQKLDNEAPIDNTPKQINFNESLWKEIAKLTSEEAELAWFKTYSAKHAKPTHSKGEFYIKVFSDSHFAGFAYTDLFDKYTLKLINRPHYWEEIDRFTSRKTQFDQFKDTVCFAKDQQDAENQLKSQREGKFRIWKSADGSVQMLIKLSTGSQLINISLEENLCKKIIETLTKHAPQERPKTSPKATNIPKATNKPQLEVIKAKAIFLKALNPSLTESEISKTSFEMIKNIFKKAQLTNHPDRAPDNKKADAQARIQAINEAKDVFIKAIETTLKISFVFNEADLALIDNMFIS